MTRVSKSRSRLRITSQIKYRKNVWGLVKKMLDKAAHEGIHTNFTIFGEHLHKEGEELYSNAAGQPSSKKKVLKRRRQLSSVEQRVASINKPKILLQQPSVSQSVSGQFVDPSQNKSDFLVKLLVVVLMLLVLFNFTLYYKLWSLESRAVNRVHTYRYKNIHSDVPRTEQEWLELISEQESLHDAELNRWQEILSTSITLMNHMKSTLTELKDTLNSRDTLVKDIRVLKTGS